MFKEIQKKISDLMMAEEDSVSIHLNLHKSLIDAQDSIPEYFRRVKTAFLSNFTLQGFPEVFKVRAVFHNLWLETYLAPYNQYAQEILDPKSQLNKFSPLLIYLLIDLADASKDQLKELIRNLLSKTQAQIIVFNKELEGDYGQEPRVSIFDFEEFLSRIGKNRHWYTKYKELGDFRLAPDAFSRLADSLMGYAVAIGGNRKKCLVMDLDNTVWRGIIGEDGYENIESDQELQKYILNLYDQGVILAVNSQNNLEDALTVIEKHPRMLLRKRHLSAWRINWQDKAVNMRELADELNIGLDSFVFLDDDPFQRSKIRMNFPEIAILGPANLKNYAGFYSLNLTEEDIRRGQMYTEERQRQELKSSLNNVDDFLSQLNLKMTVQLANNESIPRISQLTQKTNQFNLTTRRYSEEEIRDFIRNNWKIWTVKIEDRFGDYGLTGVCMINPNEQNIWKIDNFLLSCRILGRQIENAFLSFVVNRAKEERIEKILAEFIPTKKNKPCESFLADSHFQFQSVQKERGSHVYEFEPKQEISHPNFIEINYA